MTPYIKNQLIKLCNHPEWFNDMLIILDNNPEEPHTAILSHVQLNGVYAPDMVFNTIEEIQEYFEYVHLESQEIKFIQTTTAIKYI